MPRIAGIDIPEHKKVLYALQSIFGVGPKVAADVCQTAAVDPDKRARDLTSDEVGRIQRELDRYLTEGDLRRATNDNIDRLKRIRSYRGMRHIAGLPSRGQRTRSNGRTRRGKRRTVGAFSKEMATKMEATKTA